MGPHRSVKCSACRREVSVPWLRAQVAVAPMVLLTFAGFILGKAFYGELAEILMGGALGFMVGAILTTPLYHFFVPLVRPERA